MMKPEMEATTSPHHGISQRWGERARLQELRRQKRKTILLSTHILQEVDAVADRILFVSNGRLVYDAPIEEARSGGESLETVFHRLTADASRSGSPEPPAEPPAPEVQP